MSACSIDIHDVSRVALDYARYLGPCNCYALRMNFERRGQSEEAAPSIVLFLDPPDVDAVVRGLRATADALAEARDAGEAGRTTEPVLAERAP